MPGGHVIAPRHQQLTLLVARIGMASLFVFSGLEKVFDYRGAAGFAAAYAVPYPGVAIAFAILLELGCGVALLTRGYCRQAAAILAIWTFLLGPWFHRFWAVPPDRWQMTIDDFFHHFVMVGGLLYVVVFGAGETRARTD